MTAKVSIIFPTFNGWEDTKECLESIANINYPKSKLELIVIDNASTDRTVLELKNLKTEKLKNKNHPELKIINNHKNLGFARAVNKGIKTATGDYFLITNNDVTFDKNFLSTLVEYLREHPIVGIVGGKVYYKKTRQSAGRPKNEIAFGGARFDFYTGILKPSKNHNQTQESDWIPGCGLVIRREVLENVGLFDEKFFFYFEDLDLCLRAKKARFKVIYYPKAVMYHGEGVSIKREGWQRNSQVYYEGKTRILFKHAAKIQLFSSLLFQFSLGMLFQLVILRRQQYIIALKALMKVLKSSTKPLVPSLPITQLLITSPSVSIIFPTLNGKNLLPKLLNSIKRQNYQGNIEVIVVDNGSNDGTSDSVRKEYPDVKLISLPANVGSAPAISKAAKIAQNDYILATNDDVAFDKNCVHELVKLSLSDERIGIVTGKMMTMEKTPKHLHFGFRMNMFLGYHFFDFTGTNKVREADFASGACILVKKKLMKKLNYFDNEYIFCGDDLDFTFRVKQLGYKIMYTPKAVYFHKCASAQARGDRSQENLFAHFRGKFRFMIKNGTPWQILTFLPVQLLIAPVNSYIKFGHKTFFPILKALVWNTKHLNKTLKARQKSKIIQNSYFLK